MSRHDQPGHGDLREGDLLAYLEGAAPAPIAAHIAACPRCQAELVGLRAIAELLGAALARVDCPSAETLLRHQAGLLAADEARAVAAHLAICPDCAAELALLAEPPAPGGPVALARSGLRLLRALLQPAPQPALALRGGESGARRLNFAVEGYQLLVAITPGKPASAGAHVEGQLLAPGGATPGTARLRGGGVEHEAEVDELGFFAFDRVAPGVYALELALAELRILAEPLEVL